MGWDDWVNRLYGIALSVILLSMLLGYLALVATLVRFLWEMAG